MLKRFRIYERQNPPKRRDRKTSFRHLVDYVSQRDDRKGSEPVTRGEDATASVSGAAKAAGFEKWISYVEVNPVHQLINLSVCRLKASSMSCLVRCFVRLTAFP